MTKCFAITILVISFALNVAADNPVPDTYYPDPAWNRLNKVLFLRAASNGREYGLDGPDILYWVQTKNLLVEPSHSRALAALDDFINHHDEKLVTDPLKRALLQRDLWELFDWSVMPWPNVPHAAERKELQRRLAIVIRRLALTTNEIAALPDNYAQAEKNGLLDLPQGLFETNGDWVNLSPQLYGDLEIAPAHDHSFGACSPFLVFMRTPGGRQATTNYLYKLDTFDRAWVYETNQFNGENSQQLTFSPNLPQFPPDTEFALVRRLCVIDTDGDIRPTPMVISIQKRHYLAIARPGFHQVSNRMVQDPPPQKFFEFRMDRARNAALRKVGDKEQDFILFDSMGFDMFEGLPGIPTTPQSSSRHEPSVLEDCAACHSGAGIYSVNSYIRLFSPRFTDPPKLFPSDVNSVVNTAVNWKRARYNWGLLQGLWNQTD